MPQGLQTFDSNGNVIIDITTRIQKYLGTIHCPENVNSGSVYHEELDDGDLWYLVIPLSNPPLNLSGNLQVTYSIPSVWKDGKNIKWSWSANHVASQIIYGVY